ncbi:hypothetical protein G6F70_008937 [Rhizopus microsporus]|nr:hypothetical protein G6F71_008900 [Rhizopus microsporus]KAG1194042.1 hypothetical protein G6F70_008937 [Rhizopus microsporus]KAG1211348.1 hypothetical protein G6F69_004671 [Rhizopus microsporus]KAG1233144.1 hypothetical protein G6F67_004485 [Rhizopus microsporus]KAG1264073.1 hypothetical protein G6F68_004655 [Rhizopus microsporus]
MSQLIIELRPIDLSLAETKPALIAVSPTVSIQTALNLMSHNKITSLPIYSHKNTDIVSIINLLDILLYLVQGKEIEKEQLNLQDPVESVLGLDIDRESYRMHKTDRSDRLIETLRVFASGKHRSLVVNFNDPQDKCWLLSQTDIIRHIVNHPDSVSGLLDLEKSVQDLTVLSEQQLVTASDEETALNVYRFMANKNFSGLPVVDKQGQFIADLCVEDLPNANLETIDQLALPCKEYVKKSSHHSTPSVATPDTLLKNILDTMIQKDTHRVWILDSNDSKKVKGVITMSDIIALLCQHAQPSLF